MIKEEVEKILNGLPFQVKLVVATKKRNVSEIEEAIDAGIKIVGENYVNEAQAKFETIGRKVKWHLIGHLQKNKAKKAVQIFDMIESLDSKELAEVLDLECKKINKIMPVLIEVNSASENQKAGVFLEDVEKLVEQVIKFDNLKLMGLMTMGPFLDEPEDVRPFFRKTKEVFDKIKGVYPENSDWKYLSMGMSDTYKIAISEGANVVRVGTAIFGARL